MKFSLEVIMQVKISLYIFLLLSIFGFGRCQYNSAFPLQPRIFFGSLLPFNSSQSGALSLLGGESCLTFDALTGTCVSFFSCISTGGRMRGKCGFGLKACCFPASPISSGNMVKDISSELSDSLTIRRISSAYCQVRVDFTTFTLEDVDINGNCVAGQWTVTGQRDRNAPSLCGTNTGQHLYLNFDSAGTPITMNLVTAAVSSNWNVKSTQIACSDQQNLAPPGCLQYYPGPNGNVKSFNYVNIQDTGNRVTYQKSNLDYIVCIDKPSTTFNTITWTRDMSSPLSFTLTLVSASSSSFLGDVSVLNTGNASCHDFVGISNGRYTNASSLPDIQNIFCGLGFPSSITSTPSIKPFALRVFTNADELITIPGDEGNVGFSLNFMLS